MKTHPFEERRKRPDEIQHLARKMIRQAFENPEKMEGVPLSDFILEICDQSGATTFAVKKIVGEFYIQSGRIEVEMGLIHFPNYIKSAELPDKETKESEAEKEADDLFKDLNGAER
jgi:hypothetical protein